MSKGGVNKVILIGNLGQDPELRYTPSGQAVCDLSLATNESWTGKDGQKQDRTEWHRVVLWGKQAELAKQYLHKGSQVYFEGGLRTEKWTDKKTGTDRYTTKIHASTMVFLGGGGESKDRSAKPRDRQDEVADYVRNKFSDDPRPDDDIPF